MRVRLRKISLDASFSSSRSSMRINIGLDIVLGLRVYTESLIKIRLRLENDAQSDTSVF